MAFSTRLTCKVFFIIALFIFLIAQINQPALAELATGRDWIGLYVAANSSLDYDIPMLNGSTGLLLDWVYAGSCNKTPGTVALSGTCPGTSYTSANPMTSGSYLYRFFPNDTSPANSLYPTDKSDYFWVTYSITKTEAGCVTTGQPRILLNWDNLLGVSSMVITRSTTVGGTYSTIATLTPDISTGVLQNFYNDAWPSVAKNTLYYYKLQAHSAQELAGDSPLGASNEPTNATTGNCFKPFIQTREGDVHSNDTIDLQGGPTPAP